MSESAKDLSSGPSESTGSQEATPGDFPSALDELLSQLEKQDTLKNPQLDDAATLLVDEPDDIDCAPDKPIEWQRPEPQSLLFNGVNIPTLFAKSNEGFLTESYSGHRDNFPTWVECHMTDGCSHLSSEAPLKDESHKWVRVFQKSSTVKAAQTARGNRDSYECMKLPITKITRSDGYRKTLCVTATVFEKLEQMLINFPNFDQVTRSIMTHLYGLRFQKANQRVLPNILLNGPSGIGKTMYAKSLAQALEIPFNKVSMATTTSVGELSGLTSKWGNGSSGVILRELSTSESASHLLLLDELDKAPQVHHSNMYPTNSLIDLLDKEAARTFKDHYIDFEFDASHIFCIATSNSKRPIESHILSRLEVFDVPPPSHAQRKYILTRMIAQRFEGIRFSEDALERVAGVGNDLRLLSQVLNASVGDYAKSIQKHDSQHNDHTVSIINVERASKSLTRS